MIKNRDLSVPGQINLFDIESFNTQTVASNFDSGLNISDTSTRSKASLRPRITRKVLDEVAIKLTTLEPLS